MADHPHPYPSPASVIRAGVGPNRGRGGNLKEAGAYGPRLLEYLDPLSAVASLVASLFAAERGKG